MHFDIVEAIRQKQREQIRSISIDNGDPIDISVENGKVVVNLGPRLEAESEEGMDSVD